MARSSTDTCCLTLPLKLEKWQEDRLAKRFEIARQLYNTLLRYEMKKLRRLEQTPEYREVEAAIKAFPLREDNEYTTEQKALFKQREKLRKDAGFTEDAFKSDMGMFYKHFKDNIASSVAVHGIAPQVWTAFDRLFYGNGRQLHFKSVGELNSVRGYSQKKSGGTEIMFRGTYVEWNGLKLPVKLDEKNAYETEMLSYHIKYCRILRRPGKTRSHWYVQLSLRGKPAVKRDKCTGTVRHPVGSGTVGIDIGPQTIAYCSQSTASLQVLADGVQNIENQKRLLQRKLDRSRRAMNPDNYAADGTIRRGVKLTRYKSVRYRRLQKELAYLQYQQAEMRKRQHNALANELLSLGDRFYVEDMAWPQLTHRSKKTEISEKTGRYKRKKRFGKSVANRAPAALIAMLNQKLVSRGYGAIEKVDTRVRASQYNHLSDTYEKKTLSQRWNDMPDGRRIQRDLYSAFLLQHMNSECTDFDKEALCRDYEKFVILHDQAMERVMSLPNPLTSMGVRRSVS